MILTIWLEAAITLEIDAAEHSQRDHNIRQAVGCSARHCRPFHRRPTPAGVAEGRIGVHREPMVGRRNQLNQRAAVPARAAGGSTKVAVLASSPGTVTGCVIVAPATPVTASRKVTTAPAVHPPGPMLTS